MRAYDWKDDQPLPSEEWRTLGEVTKELQERMLVNESRFILDHWTWKYVHIRVDMRTGWACVRPGHIAASNRFDSEDQGVLDSLRYLSHEDLVTDDTRPLSKNMRRLFKWIYVGVLLLAATCGALLAHFWRFGV